MHTDAHIQGDAMFISVNMLARYRTEKENGEIMKLCTCVVGVGDVFV